MNMPHPLHHQNASALDAASVLNEEQRLRASGETFRARDMARAIGVPEAGLVDAHRHSGGVVPLRRPAGPTGYGDVLVDLISAKDLMALTRNEACVSEKHGAYTEPSFQGAMGQVVGEIDLRLFLGHWVHGYAVTEQTKKGEHRSLQFFDKAGDAVHKIYATDGTDVTHFRAVIDKYTDKDMAPPSFSPSSRDLEDKPDEEIDTQGLLNEWKVLEHSHDFFGLLRKFGVSRPQAMRLGRNEFTRRVSASMVDRLLYAAAEQGVPLMIFVSNAGCIQIFSGAISRVARVKTWLNVLDPRFNLHLRSDMIDNAWVVRKPSRRGDVHSLELFDATGFCFAQIFGERKPGTTERDDWRTLVTSLTLA